MVSSENRDAESIDHYKNGFSSIPPGLQNKPGKEQARTSYSCNARQQERVDKLHEKKQVECRLSHSAKSRLANQNDKHYETFSVPRKDLDL